MKKITYKEFKKTYPTISIDSDYFAGKTIEVFEEDEILTCDLILSAFKNPRIYLKNLTVKGTIKNSFAAFGTPIVVKGKVTCDALLVSGSIVYIDFSEVEIKTIFSIYAYEGQVSILSGNVAVFLDDTEYASSLLSYLKVDYYISYEPVCDHKNVKHLMRFPELANLFPNENWIEDNDKDEYLEEDEAEIYPKTTSAWKITDKVEDYKEFVELLREKK